MPHTNRNGDGGLCIERRIGYAQLGDEGAIMSVSDPRIVLDPQLDVYPDTSLLVTEDGKPVDNLFVEKQYRLLTEPLWTSWSPPDGKPFRVLANVGLFYKS